MNNETTFCPNCLRETAAPGSVCEHCGFDMAGYTVLPHQLIPGSLIKQRYRVGRVLGEGGFGITYVGWDTVLNIKTAIKEFYMSGYVNRNHDASPTVFATLGTHQDTFAKNKSKFLSEARVLAHFYEEPGIVGVRDFCEENGTAYIIMDFLEGVTLKEYLRRNGRLSPTQAVHLLLPVIRSLQRVHTEGIIHRDISPDNIMVLPSGQTKLLDFGAAREISQTDIKSLSVILKPGYAPEEQYRSKGHQGPWTDVYALAATLYRCITGQEPDDAMERMYRDQLPAPADTEAGCPIAISNVIMKAMAVRQPDRYQDVGAFLAGLEQALAAPDDPATAPAERERPAARPAAPDGSRTVLADETTGRTVLADSPAPGEESAAPAAAQTPEPPAAPAARPVTPPAQPNAAPRPAPQKAEPPKAAPKAPEKGGKKKPPLLPIAAAAAVVVIGAAVLWPKGGSPAAPAAASGTGAGAETAVADPADLMKFTLNGQSYELPLQLDSLLQAGWVFEDETLESASLAPGELQHTVVLLNEYGSITATIKNQSTMTQPLAQCSVTTLTVGESSLNNNYLGEVGNAFAMGRGGEIGGSFDAFLSAYPELVKGNYRAYEYKGEELQLTGSENSEGNLGTITLSTTQVGSWVDSSAHFVGEPAEYSDEAFLEKYALPQFSFTLNGENYACPLTVQSLVDAGWTVERAPDYLPAYSYASVYLRYDVRTTIEVKAYNYTANAIEPAYGLLLGDYGLSVQPEEAGTPFFALNDQVLVSQGDTESAVRSQAQANGLSVENMSSGTSTLKLSPADSAIAIRVYFTEGQATGYSTMIDYDVIDVFISSYQYEDESEG